MWIIDNLLKVYLGYNDLSESGYYYVYVFFAFCILVFVSLLLVRLFQTKNILSFYLLGK